MIATAVVDPKPAVIPLSREMRQVLAELELISHVPAVNLNPSGRDAGEDVGGKCPPGGADRKDDRERDFPHKSVEHFRRRIANAHSKQALRAILDDARVTLQAWRRQPLPADPEFGTPQWKRWAAESELSAVEIARKYGVSRQYVHRVRAQYRND